jgi:hypothetical protein
MVEAKLDLWPGDVCIVGKGDVHGATPNLDTVKREYIRLVLQYFEGRTVATGLAEGISGIGRS